MRGPVRSICLAAVLASPLVARAQFRLDATPTPTPAAGATPTPAAVPIEPVIPITETDFTQDPVPGLDATPTPAATPKTPGVPSAYDPEFPYALQDLDALKKRVADYRKAREGALPTQTNLIWDRIADAKLTGYERALAVENLLKIRRDERRFRALLADAQKILAISMPDPPPGTIAAGPEAALFAQVEAQFELRMRDDAVRSAETYLKRYPAGVFYRDVEVVLDHLVTERKRQNGQKNFFAERAEKLEVSKKEAREKYTGEELEKRLYSLESERCDLIDRFSLVIWDVMAKECGDLVKKYENDPRDWVRDDIRQARFRLALALGELGRFDEAVPLMRKIETDNPLPAAMGYYAKDTLEKDWPADAVPQGK